MKIKIKKLHPNATINSYAKDGDAGIDFTCTEINNTKDFLEYKTGVSIELPRGYVGLLFPRSSNTKKNLILGNSVGVLDSGFRGEICFRYKNVKHSENHNDYWDENVYNIGDKIGQILILPYPEIEFIKVNELEDSQRGDSGWGSTNK